jgi:peptidoglycan/xylan/chitin deacetylase (PgdA/CDA1 family)
MSAFIISLDFELFWGVVDSESLSTYGENVLGEWTAIPQMLALFRRYEINVTWATVGMVMCRDYEQWRQIRPPELPSYKNKRLSTYNYGFLAEDYPDLFFARPLVEQILETPGQELASHTYSHYFCNEEGASASQFMADMKCAVEMSSEVGTECSSIVLPRNQIMDDYVSLLPSLGIDVYRGNADHWIYRGGHDMVGGLAGRAARLADAWLPLRDPTVEDERTSSRLVNLPASLFLRPWSPSLAYLEPLRMHRLFAAMTAAAKSDRLFHLWWHPHNFGVNQAANLQMLEALLQHFARLRDRMGMQSLPMRAFAASANGKVPALPTANIAVM